MVQNERFNLIDRSINWSHCNSINMKTLILFLVLLIVMYIQNMNNVDVYCLGVYECEVPNVNMIFLIKMDIVLKDSFVDF